MKEIAIVSKNKTLSRFIELEVASCGAIPRIYSSLPRDIEPFSLVLIDIDTVEAVNLTQEPKVFFLSADPPEADDRSFSIPPSLIALRGVIMGAGEVRHTSQREKGTEGEPERTVVIDDVRRLALLDGESFYLSEYEMKILVCLCENSGRAVSREKLNQLLGANDGNIADVYVCRLRKKLEKGGERKVIYTVRGSGYMTRYTVSKQYNQL